MRTWTARKHVAADPEVVRVSGQLVGRRVGFDVEVHAAGNGRLALSPTA
jgi:hypothetical protein